MRRILRVTAGLLAGSAGRAAADHAGDPPGLPATARLDLVSAPNDTTVLPVRLPGYELRVLDARKLVYFNVAGSWVEIPLPILFYFPTASRAEALRVVRQAAEALRGSDRSAGAPPVDPAALAAQLDRAAALLE
jgi:hypothetical protein